jgi:hypothetical protein
VKPPQGKAGIVDQEIIDHTRRWIASVVIGLNLCPFAQRVFLADKIRYVVSDAADEATLFQHLTAELETLAVTPSASIETTLLIHPGVLADFLDYHDFVGVGERVIEELGLEGVIQIAGFHPEYRFADTEPDDAENYTNRSPYPMLHLLREDSVTAVASDPDALDEIPRRNIQTMRTLGSEKIRALGKAVAEGRDPPR